MYKSKEINRIYYYCGLEAFVSIMENSSIRMCDILKSNDSAEIEYGRKLLRRYLKSICISFCNERNEDSEIKEFFSNIDYNTLITETIDNNQLIYYSACFSSERDLLSQWRGYANDGKGVAVGFFTQDFINQNQHKNIRFGKIIYDEETQKECLKKCVWDELNIIKKANGEIQYSSFENALKKAIYNALYEIAFFKNNAFKEESEWRLVCYFNYNNLNVNVANKDGFKAVCYNRVSDFELKAHNDGLITRKIKFRCSDKKLSSYIEFNFQDVKKNIVSDVMIGPKSEIDNADIGLFLSVNGYDLSKIKIRKSVATYQ